MYKAASHIGVKKDQDRTACIDNLIIVCDGIGEFNQSALAAETLIDNLKFNSSGDSNSTLSYISNTQEVILKEKIEGGTTLIFAAINEDQLPNRLRIAYLGNGSIIQLSGDFSELPNSYGDSNKFYRYSNLLIPHVDKEGVLLKHVSHHSEPKDLIPTFMDLTLSAVHGDILLLFSDGICTLEDEIIVQDEQGRIWRNQSESVVFIMDALHNWLKVNCNTITNETLEAFIKNTLNALKELKKLEDDASCGAIITEDVISYYREKYA
jgi:serine/threonine protein phosphatase PrpC